MKKVMILILCVVVFGAMALAQNPIYAQGSVGINGIDKLGAHQNGGRGCTGCHAPHSGGAGGGGNKAGGAAAFGDPNSGSVALWGQDTTPLLGATLNFSGYTEVLPAADNTASGEVTGIMFCLSCHDGNVATGGMMTNKLYEQKIGKLPAGVYGPNSIPTLLASDGSSNNYLNDHPVGVNATIGAVLSTNANAFVITNGAMKYSAGVNTNYDQFVSNYGNFFSGRATLGYAATPAVATSYLLCTTCHTPHSMYSASGTWGGVSGNYPTYFFLVAPYNPGSLAAVNDGTKASSATQFCRSCHFTGAGGSNEGSGIMNVKTAF
jgi:hypothetical protein